MQLTLEQVKDLLQKAGVQVVMVEKEEESDFNLETALNSIDAARTPIIKDRIGAELIQPAVDEAQGKIVGIMKSEAARITGLPTSDFNGLKPSEILKKTGEAVKSTLDVDKQQLLTEREQMVTAHNAEKTKIEQDLKGEIGQWESKYNERDLREALREKHKTLNLPTTANRNDLSDEFFELNKGKYKMTIEDGKIVIKDNTDKRPFKEGSTTQFLEIDDLINSRYEKAGLIVKDTRGERADKHMQNQNTNTYNSADEGDKVRTMEDVYESMAK